MQKIKSSKTAVKYKAIKYICLSVTDEKSGESDSIANQRRIIDDFLKKHPEIEIVGEKIDDGWSGIIFDRPAFNEMIDEFKEGSANCCVTKDLSRFGREYIETGRYLRYIFPNLGVRFIAINDNIDTLTDSGDDLIVSIKTVINDAYSQDISLKTRSALAAKRANGEYVGACPIYGYKKSDHSHNLLVIDEYTAEIVREIFRMKMEGLSAYRIADTLNEQGVLSPHRYKKENGLPIPKHGYSDKENAKLSASTILRILKDETYTGTLIQGIRETPNYKIKEVVTKPSSEWVRTENAHEAIITKRTFDFTQNILKLDTRTAPNSDKVHIFSGILICGSCGNHMTRKSVPHKEVKYQYYYCRTTKKHGCDGLVMQREEVLTDFILRSMKSHISNIISLKNAILNLDADEMTGQLKKHITAKINENKRQLEIIRGYDASLDKNLLSGNIMKAEYKLLKDNYMKDADIHIADNERLQLEINNSSSYKHEQMAWMEHFIDFSDINELDRRAVVSLIHHIKVKSKTKIEVVFHYQPEYEAALLLIGSVK